MPRFYTPDAVFTVGESVVMPEKARHHAGRVLRLVAGDTVTLFDGRGHTADGPISFEGKDAFVLVEKVETPAVETPVEMTLVQSLVNPDKADWIIEKAVETGVAHIIMIPAERSVTKLTAERLEKRLAHWQDVIVSACEQCGRNVVPDIRFLPAAKVWSETAADMRYILAPSALESAKLSGIKSVAFAVGPEGGFSEKEISAACEAGWQSVLIGPRVLRTETAGIVAATLANAMAGDYKVN